MTSVARKGPATQANEMMARVFTTSDGVAPEYRRCANSSVLPTLAGPPSARSPARATGSDVLAASSAARASVRNPHTSIGPR